MSGMENVMMERRGEPVVMSFVDCDFFELNIVLSFLFLLSSTGFTAVVFPCPALLPTDFNPHLSAPKTLCRTTGLHILKKPDVSRQPIFKNKLLKN